MNSHSADYVVEELGRKLATRSRHVCILLGAGASRACGLPDLACLQDSIQESLTGDDRATYVSLRKNYNLEQILSRLRRIASLLDDDTGQKIDNLTAQEARDLDRTICNHIVEKLKIGNQVGNQDLSPMEDFARWISRTDYHLPVEVFTVNYDLALETAFEGLQVPYFDGFVGVLSARFRTDLVEASDKDDNWLPRFLVRLWKLHGSIHWKLEDKKQASIVRLGTAVDPDSVAAIYPSDAKYEESRRVPFVVLQDRFRRALHQPETLVLISGYSFSDDHLNEIIFEAAQQCQRSEFWAFCHRNIPDILSEKAVRIPNLQVISRSEAIIGCNKRNWKCLPDGLSQDYWDADKRKVTLGDFKILANYLGKSNPHYEEEEFDSDELDSN